ncbi:MAG: small ribosomal subunit Rsm22 family protein, partial [Deltaproteobacteria bacterium]|nr:small ribosomal subunit Rsm22 family protein [Deltaproteobacteria bacterium]
MNAQSWSGKPLKILDLGSGPGTGVIGSCLFFGDKNIPLEITAMDQNRSILQEAEMLHEKLVHRLSLHSQLKTRVIDFEREPISRVLKGASFDLILLVNTLNEIRFDKRVRLIEQLLRGSLTSGGKILIVEPALQRTTRELMELHDHLLEGKTAKVLAPCLHQHSCPMLREGQRDWCHTYL